MFNNAEQFKQEADYTLADLYRSEEYGSKVEVTYEYDYGDSWEHRIVFVGREEPSMRKAMRIPDDLPVVCLSREISD